MTEHITTLTLSAHGLTAKFMTWGAVLMDLRLAGHDAPLVLGFDTPDPYPEHSPYCGATAGRFANRIGQGQWSLDGVAHQTDRNFLGKHTLHGGGQGIGKRNWQLVTVSADRAVFRLTDPDGAMGFPGTVHLFYEVQIKPGACLSLRYTAKTDAPTLVNLAHHSYFALDDTGGLDHHHLQVDADHYLPVDDELIPTGQIADVTGTRFDFRAGRPVLDAVMIDHNLCTARAKQRLRPVGRLWSQASGVSMQIATTEPGLQVYDGANINPGHPGLDGRDYGAYSGVALEPQGWPDAPNHDDFPSAVLRPGQTYEQITEFSFSMGDT